LFSTPNAGVSISTAENHTGPDGEIREWTYQDKLDLARQVGFTIEKTYGTFTGITYLPDDVRQKVQTDPMFVAMKEFFDVSLFNCVIATANPVHSNNSIFLMRRPA